MGEEGASNIVWAFPLSNRGSAANQQSKLVTVQAIFPVSFDHTVN